MKRGQARKVRRFSRTSFPSEQSCIGLGHGGWTEWYSISPVRLLFTHQLLIMCLTIAVPMIGGGYMLPPQKEHFDMLLALQREFKGAVGFALLNYGAPFTPTCAL